MSTQGERLREARFKAGYRTATAASERVAKNYNTYAQHENGTRPFDADDAERYGRAFGVDPAWLMWGKAPRGSRPKLTPVVGYVGAGDAAHYYDMAELDYVDTPENANDNTVAVRVRGASMGAVLDGAIVFYDDVRSPVTPDLLGSLCVVGLADGRVLLKQLSRAGEQYILVSTTEPPIVDAEIAWAAKVTSIRPR